MIEVCMFIDPVAFNIEDLVHAAFNRAEALVDSLLAEHDIAAKVADLFTLWPKQLGGDPFPDLLAAVLPIRDQ